MSAADGGEDAQRLYGLVGAEELHDDPAGVWETEIAPNLDWYVDKQPVEVEEFTVRAQRDILPPISTLNEWLVEWSSENEVTEGWYDHLAAVVDRPDVVKAAGAYLSAIAERIGYRMADKHVVSHFLTWPEGDEPEPLLDGEPLYHGVPEPTEAESKVVGLMRALEESVAAAKATRAATIGGTDG